VSSSIAKSVARAQVEHRLARSRERARASEYQHPPSVVRRGLASAVARVAGRIDAESARRSLALK
jgi:hypothetical protein